MKKDPEVGSIAEGMAMWIGECEAGMHDSHPKYEALFHLLQKLGFNDPHSQSQTHVDIVVKLIDIKLDVERWINLKTFS